MIMAITSKRDTHRFKSSMTKPNQNPEAPENMVNIVTLIVELPDYFHVITMLRNAPIHLSYFLYHYFGLSI